MRQEFSRIMYRLQALVLVAVLLVAAGASAQGGIRNFAVSGDFTLSNFTDAIFVRNPAGPRELFNRDQKQTQLYFWDELALDQSNRALQFALLVRSMKDGTVFPFRLAG